MVAQMGGQMETLYWTQGRYDLVGIMEAPDEETAAAVGLRVGATGSVRTETLRAYDAEEMGRILAKVGCAPGAATPPSPTAALALTP